MMLEYWSQNLDQFMNKNEDQDFDNEEKNEKNDKYEEAELKNKFDLYGNANNQLKKVSPSISRGQKAGIGRGSGPLGPSRQ